MFSCQAIVNEELFYANHASSNYFLVNSLIENNILFFLSQNRDLVNVFLPANGKGENVFLTANRKQGTFFMMQ